MGLNEVNEVGIKAMVRDFKKSHPDFQRADDGLQKGLVEQQINTQDRKPVYKGGTTLEGKEFFDQWYNNVGGVNMAIEKTLNLTKNAGGLFVFDKPGYFPIDGEGWGEEIVHLGKSHNYYFTLEMHHIFKYHGGEIFKFRGDDDLWVFINDKLVIDLGGTHSALAESVQLDDLGLEKGTPYNLDLFFAERKTFDSNFFIETTIHLEEQVTINLGNDSNKCCLIEAFNFLCYEEKQWWTFWCS